MEPTTLLNRLRGLFSRAAASAPEAQTPEASAPAPTIDFRAMLECSLDMICHVKICQGQFQFTYTSPITPLIFGWSCEELLLLKPADLFTEAARGVIQTDIAAIMGGLESSTVLTEAIHKDGHIIWLENKVRVLEHRGDVILLMIAMRDVTEKQQLQDQLAQMAIVDSLTNIHNRRAFDQVFKVEWRRALRSGDPLSILLLEIDGFKLLNDIYGHQAGNDCLRAIARALRATVQRAGDLVARYRGEEFVIILPNTDAIAAEFVAYEVVHAIRRLEIPHAGNREAGSIVSISCGAATAPGRLGQSISTPEDLLLAADKALRKARQLGRNRVESSLLLTSDAALDPHETMTHYN